eukprot:TRINITY_DN1791_c0_g1_i1.p1 TRINITY_DN1791_c0_g1~~TRINITY_DN1791_c0_g1_i1.p1  ORF type:complete len:279 (+),score=22.19 TRINITY_DN1791_c0_g1_i1:247-1083(+)
MSPGAGSISFSRSVMSGATCSTSVCCNPLTISCKPSKCPAIVHLRPRISNSKARLRLRTRAANDDEASLAASPSAAEAKPNNVKTQETPIRMVSVDDTRVPVEGVIKLDNEDAPNQTSFFPSYWRSVAVVGVGDILGLLAFAAIVRQMHSLPVVSWDTLHLADHLVAGWILSAYFLGAFGSDGLGHNGKVKALIAITKSWAVGIPLGLLLIGIEVHLSPAVLDVLISMGGTFVLLLGWRFLFMLFSPKFGKDSDRDKQYKSGNPFEFLELLFSLVRRW